MAEQVEPGYSIQTLWHEPLTVLTYPGVSHMPDHSPRIKIDSNTSAILMSMYASKYRMRELGMNLWMKHNSVGYIKKRS